MPRPSLSAPPSQSETSVPKPVNEQGAHYFERGTKSRNNARGSGSLFKTEFLDGRGGEIVARFFIESAE